MRKTTPVRWWRDDATRYVTRGPQAVPAAAPQPMPAWAIELLAPMDPSLTAELQRIYDAATPEALTAAFALPPEVLSPNPMSAWATYRSIEDDLRAWQADVERERRRLGGVR